MALRFLSIFSILISLLLSGCLGSGSAEVESFLGGTTGSGFGELGNSAIDFEPRSYDFGSVSVGSTATKVITIKNKSAYNLFFNGFTGGNTNFTISSHDCPSYIFSGASCIVNIQFNPQSNGTLATTLTASYAQSSGGTNYISETGLSGRGVSALSFSGIDTISNVTTTSVQINWTANSNATTFQVYKIVSGSMVFVSSVTNTGGTVANTTLTGLTANTAYTYRVRAIDVLGNQDTNTNNVSITTDAIGTFATGTLTTSEGNAGTLNLNTLCTDTEANTPSSYTLNSQTSTNASPGCSIAANTLSCTPAYKTGHAAWSETANITCSLNGSDITQTVTISVTDTNIAAALTAISNQTGLIAGNAITTVNANAASDTQADGDAYNYLCYYDTTVDAAVASTTACSNLSASAMSYSFTASTGVFDWTPGYSQGNVTYEFKIIADDGTTTASQIFTIQVLPAVPIITHVTAGDLTFPSNQVAQGGSVSVDFSNTRSGSPSDTGMSYTCYYDINVDGAVAASTLCTAISGTPTFDTNTGVLAWTVPATAYGPFEIKVTGTNAAGSASEIFIIDVKQSYATSNLLAYWDASFVNMSGNGSNSTVTTNWDDLVATGTGYDGTLTNFSGTTSSGWAGSGTSTITSASTGPHRLALDGTNDYVNFGTGINSQSSLLFDLWVRPTSTTTTGSVILQNGNSSNHGITLKQTSWSDEKLELKLGSGNSYSEIVKSKNPIAYWRMNDVTGTNITSDISGNRNNGATTNVTFGAAGALATTGGDSDKAISLAATGYSTVPDSTSLSVTGANLTISLWIKPTVSHAGVLVHKESQFTFKYNSGALTYAESGNWSYANTGNHGSITAGVWSHVAVVTNSSGYKFYINGVSTGAGKATTTNMTDNANPVCIGAYGCTSQMFNGSIDEVAIFNSELTGAEILAQYQAGAASFCRSNGPLINNLWHHIAGIFNGSNDTLSLFVNGVSQCSVANAAGITLEGSSSNLTLGTDTSGTNAFSGSVGELRTYSTGTSTEVSTNFTETKTKYSEYLPLENLVLWLKADSIKNATNGMAISLWEDSSGNGNPAFQTTAGYRPTYQSTGLNSLPTVVFDGTDDFFTVWTTNFPTGSTARSFFAVYKAVNTTSRTALFSYGTGANGQYYAVEVNSYNGGTSSGDIGLGFWADGYESSNAGTNPVTAGTASIFSLIYTGGTPLSTSLINLWANGTLLTTELMDAVAGGVVINTQSGNGRIGTRASSPIYGAGSLSELLFYSGALNTSDRQRVERYLGTKYGITVP